MPLKWCLWGDGLEAEIHVSLQEGVKTENDHINLKVAGQDGSVVQFKIKRHTPLSKLMKAYCERQVWGGVPECVRVPVCLCVCTPPPEALPSRLAGHSLFSHPVVPGQGRMSGDVFVALLESEWRLRLGLHPSTFAPVGPMPSAQFRFQTMLGSCPLFTTFRTKEPMLVCPPTVTRETDRPECGACVTCERDCALGPLGPLCSLMLLPVSPPEPVLSGEAAFLRILRKYWTFVSFRSWL